MPGSPSVPWLLVPGHLSTSRSMPGPGNAWKVCQTCAKLPTAHQTCKITCKAVQRYHSCTPPTRRPLDSPATHGGDPPIESAAAPDARRLAAVVRGDGCRLRRAAAAHAHPPEQLVGDRGRAALRLPAVHRLRLVVRRARRPPLAPCDRCLRVP